MGPQHTAALGFRTGRLSSLCSTSLRLKPRLASTRRKTGLGVCLVTEQLRSDVGSRSESAHDPPSLVSVYRVVARWLRCKPSPQLLVLLSPERARGKFADGGSGAGRLYEVVARVDDCATTFEEGFVRGDGCHGHASHLQAIGDVEIRFQCCTWSHVSRVSEAARSCGHRKGGAGIGL